MARKKEQLQQVAEDFTSEQETENWGPAERWIRGRRYGLELGPRGCRRIGADLNETQQADMVGSVRDGLDNLSVLPGSQEFILSSRVLEECEKEERYKLVRDWAEHLRSRGRLVLLLDGTNVIPGRYRMRTGLSVSREDITSMIRQAGLNFVHLEYDNLHRIGEHAPAPAYRVLIVAEKPFLESQT